MLDRDEIMDEEVQECRPDTVVLDGITEGSGLLDRIPQIRAAAGDALIVVMIDDVSSESAERVIEADLVLCNWRGPARMRTPQREGGEGEVRRLSVAAEPRVERKRAQGGLTSRELEILRSVAEGCTNAAIARRLWVTEQTVKFHLTNIYRKLGVSNRTEAARYAFEHGLAEPDGHSAGDH
jgi:DNA-binding NarL/FixJ family response regulator